MSEAPGASPPSPKPETESYPSPKPESELAYMIKTKFSRVMREGEPFHPVHLRRTDVQRVMLCSYCKERVMCFHHEDHKMVDHFCSKHFDYVKFLDKYVNREIPPRMTAEQIEQRRKTIPVISGNYHFDDKGVATQVFPSSNQGPKEKKQKADTSVLDFLSGRLNEKKHKTDTGTSNGHTSGFTVLPADKFVIDPVPKILE